MAESAPRLSARKNGKTVAHYAENIAAVRIEDGALVHLICHPEDREKVGGDLQHVLAVQPDLRPVDLHVNDTVARGSVLIARDLDHVPPIPLY